MHLPLTFDCAQLTFLQSMSRLRLKPRFKTKKALTMRCCVPFCKNTSDNVSTIHIHNGGIEEHKFSRMISPVKHISVPLGSEPLANKTVTYQTAVDCSQHFLNDDIYETESGLWQIGTGANPSAVQGTHYVLLYIVCMICLETHSKLILISKHKLEAYEKLTGHPASY